MCSRHERAGPAAGLPPFCALLPSPSDAPTALGAFYRRLSSRIGKAKAVTATARKVAVLFYDAVRHGMEYVDPGASSYETRYRTRVVDDLHRHCGYFTSPWSPKLVHQPLFGIVLQRQLSDLGMQRLRHRRPAARFRCRHQNENMGKFRPRALRFPRCDLIGATSNCSASCDSVRSALDGRKRHL